MKLENTLIMSGVYMVMSPNSQTLGLFVKILTVSSYLLLFRNHDVGNVFINF